MIAVADEIFKIMKQTGNAQVAQSSGRFFIEPVNFLGLKSADVRSIMKMFMPQIKKKTKSDIFALAEELMKYNYMESTSLAAEIVYSVHKDYQKSDFKLFHHWISSYITNWANCDTFCNHSVNALLEMYPGLTDEIKKWTQSNNRWVRRGSAVSFVLSARKGRFLDDVFDIANALLEDTDEMVQKGYGWALKAAGESAPARVYEFVVKRRAKMPRTAYRYAIEKLPPEMRRAAMQL